MNTHPHPHTPLHATLARQLRHLKLVGSAQPPTPEQWNELLAGIDRAYHEADEMVYLFSNSERVVAEELARSQRALAQAQRIAGLGSWSLDLATGQTVLSDELANLMGLRDAPRHMPVDCLLELVAEADRTAFARMLDAAAAAPMHDAGEVRFVGVDGRERWCLCRTASHVDENGHVDRLDGTVLDISERRAADERTRLLARTDPLTGVANRAHFCKRLEAAIDAARLSQGGAAVVFIDLDGFKAVNDTCGTPVGDALLEAVARRLRGCLRETDLVGRLGGDEFVLLLPGVASAAEAAGVADKVLRACTTQIIRDDEAVSVSASVGVALFPADADSAEQLLRCADTAMGVAKDGGRNQVRFYGAEARARRRTDRALVTALRSAISRDEIGVAYQPVVDGRTLQILGMEALARWRHPTQGPIAPTEFVALAEANDLIAALCQRVATAACRQLVGLPVDLARERWLSVNVSPLQLRSGEFIRMVEGLIGQTGVDPRRLCLEITENAVMLDPALAIRMLNRLKALGVSIWLDDFGTGHSSLACLRQLPVDCIKIDRAFVAEIQGCTAGPLLQGIISMARSLGCEVLAEGVETEAQRTALLDAGCRLMQGYLFGRPDSFERCNALTPDTAPPLRRIGANRASNTPVTAAHSNRVTVSPGPILPGTMPSLSMKGTLHEQADHRRPV